MKVKDAMVTRVQSLAPDMKVGEAIAILRKRKTSGLPVIDDTGRLAGMFTEKEFLKAILPSYFKHTGSVAYLPDIKTINSRFSQIDTMYVRDAMRKEVLTVAEDVNILEAARIMVLEKARRLPVVKDGKVVGIISRCDIIDALLNK